MSDSDFMELGDGGLVPVEDGMFLDKNTGNTVDDMGRVFDQTGEMIFDPNDEEYDA